MDAAGGAAELVRLPATADVHAPRRPRAASKAALPDILAGFTISLRYRVQQR